MHPMSMDYREYIPATLDKLSGHEPLTPSQIEAKLAQEKADLVEARKVPDYSEVGDIERRLKEAGVRIALTE